MGKVKDLCNGLYYTDNIHLNAVMTLPEAMQKYGKTRRVLEYAIWQDRLEARMAVTGGSYLITVASLEKLYGSKHG